MAHLTPDQFSAKWIPLLANNVFQDIDGVRLGLLITDITDSFGPTADVNVPDWIKDTYYPLGYVLLHSFGGPAIFMQASQAGYLPVPTDPLGDANWAPALGPVVAGGIYQVGTVPALRAIKGDWMPGRLYILQNRIDLGSNTALPDVYVRALSATALEPEGYTVDPLPVRVRYELTTDVTAPVISASSFADLRGVPTDNLALARALSSTRAGSIQFGTGAGERLSAAIGFQARVAFSQWALVGNGVAGDFQFSLVKSQNLTVGTYPTLGDLNVAIAALSTAEATAGYYVLASYAGTKTSVIINFKALVL